MAENDEAGMSLLHAAAFGEVEKVEKLLDEGISPTWNKKLLRSEKKIDPKQNRGMSAIHYAAWFDHYPVIQLLIDRGVNINLQTPYGSTPLHYAAWSGATETVKYLLTLCDVDFQMQDSLGRTALHDCIDMGNVEILKYMYNHIKNKGKDEHKWMKFTAKDTDGQSLLHYAVATSKNSKIIEFLLEKRYPLCLKNYDDEIPLQTAFKKGHHDVACQLIEHYKVLNQEEQLATDLQNALFMCAKNGRRDMVQKLIEHHKVPILSRTPFQETVFHKAVEGGNRNTISYLFDYVSKRNIPGLIPMKTEENPTVAQKMKAVFDLRDDEGRNLFHFAVVKCKDSLKKQTLDFLLREGCEKPQDNEQVWQAVEMHCTKPLVKYLLEKSSKPKAAPQKQTGAKHKLESSELQQLANALMSSSKPFSKRRKLLRANEIDDPPAPTQEEFQELKTQVATLTATVQNMATHIEQLNQELQQFKQANNHMQQLSLASDLLFSDSLYDV